jgi:hypothetical protein
MVSRRYWEFYVMGMRFNSRFKPSTRLSKEEIASVLDFLEYDSHVRKIEHKEEFDKQSEQLEARFEPILDARVKRLMESLPPRMREDSVKSQ